jgi:hypothetical protein
MRKQYEKPILVKSTATLQTVTAGTTITLPPKSET